MDLYLTVFNYNDYRDLLRDWFWSSKKNNPKISFRFVAKHLGLSAPNHFHMVINRKRHLSQAMVNKVMTLMKLGARQKQYFRLLFSQDMAKTEVERVVIHEKLISLRKQLIREDAHEDKLRVVGHQLAWYVKMGAVVFANKTVEDMSTLIKETATFSVNDAEVAHAVALLVEAKELRFVNGLSVFEQGAITTKWDHDRSEVKRHHLENIKLAMESVGWPMEQRFLSSVTVACDEETYQSIISEVRALCLSILEKSDAKMLSCVDPAKVVTLQLALFPYFDFKKPSRR